MSGRASGGRQPRGRGRGPGRRGVRGGRGGGTQNMELSLHVAICSVIDSEAFRTYSENTLRWTSGGDEAGGGGSLEGEGGVLERGSGAVARWSGCGTGHAVARLAIGDMKSDDEYKAKDKLLKVMNFVAKEDYSTGGNLIIFEGRADMEWTCIHIESIPIKDGSSSSSGTSSTISASLDQNHSQHFGGSVGRKRYKPGVNPSDAQRWL